MLDSLGIPLILLRARIEIADGAVYWCTVAKYIAAAEDSRRQETSLAQQDFAMRRMTRRIFKTRVEGKSWRTCSGVITPRWA
jgi:hypothetical protein